MKDLQTLKRSIDSAESLKSIVSTMKAMASSNIVQFQNASQSSHEYREVLDKALSVTLQDREEAETPFEVKRTNTLHIVFGSDYGLAGRFNERIATFAAQEIPASDEDYVVAVGHQVVPRLEDNFTVTDTFSVPQTTDGIASMVQRLLIEIDDYAQVSKVVLYYNRPVAGVLFVEQKETLFPLDLKALVEPASGWESRSLPTFLVDRELLLSHILQQYFFITLYRAFCYSLASENASRLSSMQTAEKNIEELQDDLNFRYRLERQNSITAEINDVVSGFKSIRKAKEV